MRVSLLLEVRSLKPGVYGLDLELLLSGSKSLMGSALLWLVNDTLM
jgi:hypothetical protein